MAEAKFNHYPGNCASCGAYVSAGQGTREWRKGYGSGQRGGGGKKGGKWAVYCRTCRPVSGATPAPGAWTWAEGTPEPTPEPERMPEPTPAPALPDNGPAGSVDAAVKALVQSVAAQALDRDTVRAIAAEEAQRIALGTPTQVTVTVKQEDRDPVTVEGAHSLLADVLTYLQARHVMLVGPAGVGKTTLAEQAATALGLPFYLSGSVFAPYDVTGFVDAAGNYHSTPFRQAFENGGLYLQDEVDSCSEQALLVFNAGLANGHMAFPDSPAPVKRHPDFKCIAAANTWGNGSDREYVGRNQLDGATLNRFIRVPMDYDRGIESRIAVSHPEWLALVWRVRDRVREHRMRHIVSTRQVEDGCVLLNAGVPIDKCADTLLRQGLSDTDWLRVSR